MTGLKVVKSGHSIFNSESLHCVSRRDSCWQTLRRLFVDKVLTDRNPKLQGVLRSVSTPYNQLLTCWTPTNLCFQDCVPWEFLCLWRKPHWGSSWKFCSRVFINNQYSHPPEKGTAEHLPNVSSSLHTCVSLQVGNGVILHKKYNSSFCVKWPQFICF